MNKIPATLEEIKRKMDRPRNRILHPKKSEAARKRVKQRDLSKTQLPD